MCLITLTEILYLKPKNVFICLLNFITLFFCFVYQKNLILTFEIASIFSVLLVILHNKRYRSLCVIYLCTVSIGIFLLSLYDCENKFLFYFIQRHIFKNNLEYTIFLHDCIWIVSILCLIGFIPFSGLSMYLFSVSNVFFKLVCFVAPTIISLVVLQKYSSSLSDQALFFSGIAISIYSGLNMIFENKMRKLILYILTYFYGLQLILFSYNIGGDYINLYVLLSIMMICYCNVFAPFRTFTYYITDVCRALMTNNKYKIISFLTLSVLICIYSLYLLAHKISNIEKVVYLLFICLISKITYYLHNYKEDNNIKIIEVIKSRLIKYNIIIISIISIIIYNIYSHKYTFIKQDIESYLIFAFTFIIMLFISKFIFYNNKKPKLIKSRAYFKLFTLLITSIKIIFSILSSSIVDFFNVMYKYVKNIFISSSPIKILNILYNNNTYFYIFFLLQVIIVLTIECIIL